MCTYKHINDYLHERQKYIDQRIEIVAVIGTVMGRCTWLVVVRVVRMDLWR